MDKSYKRKNYYHKPGGGGSGNWNKRKFKNCLQPGMKGFICTCNMREKDCVRESLNILNEYADMLYGSDLQRPESKHDEEETGVEPAEDIEDELKNEVANLKAAQWTPGRFSVVDTGVKSNVFIKTKLEDPVQLAYAVLNKVAETKVQIARFLMRIVPVEVTCRANLEDIKTAADSLFDKHFRCDPTTFAIIINKRYNDSMLRDEVIHALALLVTDKNREHKANLKEAKMTILLEIMKGVCCMSVLQDYKKLRHYNLAELVKPVEEGAGGEKVGEGTDAKAKQEGQESDQIREEAKEENEENNGVEEDIEKVQESDSVGEAMKEEPGETNHIQDGD